jgi:hypothetical protein
MFGTGVAAALGALLGGTAVFGSVWVWHLGRDVGGVRPETGAAAAVESGDLDVLAEQRRESARQTAALLDAQQVVLRFLRSPDASEAAQWLDTPTAELDLVAKVIVRSPVEQGVRLERQRRLPGGAGYHSTWRVGEPATPGWAIQVNDASGAPRIDWAGLRAQLEAGPPAIATSAAAGR